MRILGIDLGSSSVKAVEMESAFGRFEVRDYYEQVIAPHETQKEALFRLLEGLPKAPDRVILGLCNGQSTFRILELPTRDRKAIQSAVGFELEDDLPFALDESTLQYSILSQNKQGSSLYVSITLKKYLAQALETWEDARFSPDVITPEEWAYRALINRIQASSSASEHPLLVVIGHQKTVFYLQDEQTPRVISEVTWGGRDLTQAISQAQNLSWDEAEKMKLNHGILLPENPPADTPAEQQELSACLARACGRLPEWIKKIDLIARSLTQREITSIYLSGGTALLPGLGAWLEQQLQMPVKPLRALSQLTSSGIVYSEETDARFLLASALSLASMSLDRIPCINLRKDEFAKAKRERKLDLRMYSKPLLSVGAIVMSLFISLTVQSMVYQSRLKATNAQLDKNIRSFFGQVSSSAMKSFLNNPTLLRNSIQKELNQHRELAKLYGPNPRSPLNFLNTLSTTLSKGVVVDLLEFKAGIPVSDSYLSPSTGSLASLTFLVSNPQIVEKLNSLLSTQLKPMEKGALTEVPSGGESPSKWKVSFSGTPSEVSYGR